VSPKTIFRTIHHYILAHPLTRIIASQLAGWAAIGMGIAMARWDEYGLALCLFIYGSVVLFLQAYNWAGFEDYKTLSDVLRVVYVLGALAILFAAYPITSAKRGDKPWSDAWNRSVHTVRPPAPRGSGKLICQVMTVQFEPVFRFFQSPPVNFERLDTMLRVSLTNQIGKPLYISDYSVATLKGVEWIHFKNADSAAFEPYAFGVMAAPGDKPFIRRFDLSANGFDYVMQHKPLDPDEGTELWMFFISGLASGNQREISQFKFTFYDSAKEEFPCTSPYSAKDDRGTVVGISTGNLKVLDFEPVPPNLREEPTH
jgi:hypothetical protein